MDQLDHYRLERPLGTGPRGCVYRARDVHDVVVAVKLIRPPQSSVAPFESVAEAFDRDVARLREAHLPGVVRHLDSGRDADGVWMAMELRSEPTLQELIAEQTLGREAAVELIAGLADALDRCHEHGVVARNLRPANVFVTADGPLLTDLIGVDRLSALLLRSDFPRERALWAAPEVVLGLRQQPTSNRYTLAQIAYLLIEHELPHDSGELFSYLHAVALEPLVVRTDNPALAEVWRRGLHTDPRRRFDSCGELAAALGAALGIEMAPEPAPVTPLEVEVERLDPLPAPPEDPRVEILTSSPQLFSSAELASEAEEPSREEPSHEQPRREEATREEPVPPEAPASTTEPASRLIGPLARGERAYLRLVPAADPASAPAADPTPAPVAETAPEPEVTAEPRSGIVAEPRPVILPDPEQLEPAADKSGAGRALPTRERRSGLWRRMRRMLRSPSPRRPPEPDVREFYLMDWQEGARREREDSFEDAQPMWPQWKLSVSTRRGDAQVWVNGEHSGPASEPVVIRAKAGAGVDLELRASGRTVARTRIYLHPMMERVWHADGEPDAD